MRVISCKLCDIEVPYAYTSTKYCSKCREKAKKLDKSQWKKRNNKKIIAENLVATEIRAKRLIKPSSLKCNRCLNQAREYHHFNYDYPLSVIPLCKKCHVFIHKGDKLI